MTTTAIPTDDLETRLLLEIERLRECTDPSIDSPEAHVSWLTAGLQGLANRVKAIPLLDRDVIARIIDDKIWDGEGDYPLERKRIAYRREQAYERADRIIALRKETV